MRNKKSNKLSSFIKAGIMSASILFSSFSTATIFVPIPQIENPLIGMAIGYILLLVFALWQFYDMQMKIKELESERVSVPVNLEVVPRVLTENKMTLDDSWNITSVYLEVFNKENLSITDCYVTLEKAEHYSSPSKKPLPAFSDVRLMWKDNLNSDCFLVIPQQNKQPKIANLWRKELATETFTFCQQKKAYSRGLYSITIRVDGKFNGKEIKPIYFEGYLHVDNNKEAIFKSGDWQNDKTVLERMSHY
jgi:hypothetical protein